MYKQPLTLVHLENNAGTDKEESNSSEGDVTETTAVSRSLVVESGSTLAIAEHPFIDNSALLNKTNFGVKG